MRFERPSANAVRAGVALFAVLLPFFWFAGGIRWLEVTVFPPKCPRFMPRNSVWIEGLSLPFSWHHGWWFGCGSSDTTNYCRLVEADGELVYGGEYLPCGSHAPIAEANIRLVAPPDSSNMWSFEEGSHGVIGFLANGNLLLPVSVQDKCNKVKARASSPR